LITEEEFQGIILDIEGVLVFQGKAYPGAAELLDLLREKGITIRILSNSTLQSRKSYAEKLTAMGFTIYESEVITASFATARYLKTLHPISCWVMLKGEGLEEFNGLNHDSDDPEYIVMGDFREGFTFQNMNKALRLLQKGSKLIVMIPEIVDNSMGGAELTVGAYGKMLGDAANIEGTYIGKPNKYVFDMTLETMDIEKNRILMVGDKIATDVVGAKKIGIRSALVKTGEFKERDLNCDIRPDYIFDSIKDIRKLFQ
jgi:HAD superfamily hydrolase (TIGR01458 family)